jgi:hypothetical protein
MNRPLTALVTGVVVLTSGTLQAEALKVPQQRDISYQMWTSTTDFLAGTQRRHHRLRRRAHLRHVDRRHVVRRSVR